MPKKMYHVNLTQTEREQLETYVKQGKKSARSINRARILLLAAENYSDEEIIETLELCRKTVYQMRKRYVDWDHQNILDLLTEKPRPGRVRLFYNDTPRLFNQSEMGASGLTF